MGFLKIPFFLLTTFYIVHATINHNLCPTTSCGTLSIDYPFQLQTSQPQNNCTYINLNCIHETTVVNLPYGGDFYVRNIEKYAQYIQLYDPDNCLMGRLIKNLNLTSSPFKAISSENYTFYTCPVNTSWELSDYVTRIDCLSNYTNSTVASTALIAQDLMFDYDCVVIGSWMLPVLGPGQFEFDGVYGDLYLTWNSTTCNVCQDENYQPPDVPDTPWAKFTRSPYFIPSFGIMAILFIASLLRATRLITRRNETNPTSPMAHPQPASATTAPPQSSTGGLDDSKIESCTELVVLSGNRTNLEPDSNTCSICLENYHPQELVRSIAKCEHCFHAECIELWLRKNRTCPVCRMLLSEIEL